jgi:hypothetical protein
VRERSLLLAALLLLLAPAARAYDQRVHEMLSTAACHVKRPPVGDAGAVRMLREELWRWGTQARDPQTRARFTQRYPTAASFDAWAMKQLFALNPDKHVAGFDDDVALPDGSDACLVYSRASRLPDDDERNRDRFRHDARRAVINDAWGQPLPDDPATLEMGGRTGLSSQAHAHYGLPRLAFSDDPDVLKHDPRRFAVPPTVHTFGADFAESYTTLAVLAAHLPDRAQGERLALTFAGAAAHHLEDVANQIHTVQVGIYDFFVDAKIQSLLEELTSLGGYVGPRRGFVSIGIDIIANHHVLAESLFAKHLLTPDDPVAKQLAATLPDAEFQAALDRVAQTCSAGFGRSLAEALIDRSSYEGPLVYRAIRAIAQRRWSRAGEHYDERDDPDAAIKPGADTSELYRLESVGARRAIQTLDAWWLRFEACHDAKPDGDAALAESLLRQRLDALDLAEPRARLWTPPAPVKAQRNWKVLAGLALVLLLIALGTRRLLHRRRRA